MTVEFYAVWLLIVTPLRPSIWRANIFQGWPVNRIKKRGVGGRLGDCVRARICSQTLLLWSKTIPILCAVQHKTINSMLYFFLSWTVVIFFSPKSPSRFLKGHMVLPLNFLAMIRSSLFEVKYKSITIGTPLLALNWSPLRLHPLLIVARYFKEIARPNHRYSYFSSKQKAVSVSRKYYWQSTCFLNKYSFVLTPVNVKPSSYTSLSGSFYCYNSSGSVCSLPLFETSTWIRAF